MPKRFSTAALICPASARISCALAPPRLIRSEDFGDGTLEPHHHRLHLQLDAETILYGSTDLPRQRKNLLRTGTAAIDQRQRMPRGNRRRPQRVPFCKTSLLDEPRRWHDL